MLYYFLHEWLLHNRSESKHVGRFQFASARSHIPDVTAVEVSGVSIKLSVTDKPWCCVG